MSNSNHFHDPREAMDAIHEFHRICEKREQTGALTLTEARRLLELRDEFEPRRTIARGAFRGSVRFEPRCAAIVESDGSGRFAELVRASLREFEIVTSAPLSCGAHVRIAVQRAQSEPLRFRGRVVGVHPATNGAVVLLSPVRLRGSEQPRLAPSSVNQQANEDGRSALHAPVRGPLGGGEIRWQGGAGIPLSVGESRVTGRVRRARAWRRAVAAIVVAGLSLAGLRLLGRAPHAAEARSAHAAVAISMEHPARLPPAPKARALGDFRQRLAN